MADLVKQMEKEVREDHNLARLVQQEELILDVTELILAKMEEKGLSKSQLASMLNTNKSHITQLLRGSRNMTLRTISDIFFGLGYKLSLDAIAEGERDRQFVVAGYRLIVCRDQAADWKWRKGPEDIVHTEPMTVTVAA